MRRAKYTYSTYEKSAIGEKTEIVFVHEVNTNGILIEGEDRQVRYASYSEIQFIDPPEEPMSTRLELAGMIAAGMLSSTLKSALDSKINAADYEESITHGAIVIADALIAKNGEAKP
jgi:hypothetical protein